MWFSVGSTFSVRYYVLQRMSTHKVYYYTHYEVQNL